MADPFDELRVAGLLLAGGGVLLVLLVGPTAFVSSAIWNGPQAVSLHLISEHRLIWRVANIGFALATIATAAGLFLMPGLVGDRGASMAWMSAVVFILAAVPWLLILAIRLAVTPGVADAFVADGTVDPAFAPLDRLFGALFPAFILIASGAIAALGAAIVGGGSLGAPLGWACLVAGVAIGGSYVVIGDTLPAFVYLPTAAVGIELLLSGR
ncbi:MAG: hypothetical protein HY262_05610 [Chloroflexi bacterium]|nr:hypothetical protein [Chloroflexota bacterium]